MRVRPRSVCVSLHISRSTAATEAARVTAEYAKYAEAGTEPLSISFPRISRIPRFNPCDDRAAVQIFDACEQIGLLQSSPAQPEPKRSAACTKPQQWRQRTGAANYPTASGFVHALRTGTVRGPKI